jgi:hypothetical protein
MRIIRGEKMTNDNIAVLDAVSGDISTLPTSEGRYRCRLETMSDIRKEQAKLYRQARSGLLDASDATKLGWLLSEVRKTVEIESRNAEMPVITEQQHMALAPILTPEQWALAFGVAQK